MRISARALGTRLFRLGIAGFVLFVLGSCSVVKADSVAYLTLQSQPSDWVGQGQDWNIAYSAAEVDGIAVVKTVDGSPAELGFVLGSPLPNNTNFEAFFGTDQLGIKMQPGVYTNAQRAAFATPGHPGLDVIFQNRGCDIDTGNFTVTDATFGPGNVIDSFAVSFEQHCEGAPAALFGTFVYNVDGVTVATTPEPSSLLLCATGLLVLIPASRWRKRSVV